MFDSTCKFLAESFPSDFASWLLGTPINLTKLSPSELSLEPIRADAIILLQSDELILHIEFQTDPEKKIPFRMADYRLRGYRRYPEKRMYQVVIYLSDTSSEEVYKTSFNLERTRHEFDVIRIWEQPEDIFLRSPGLLPFAALSRTANRRNTLQQVAASIEGINERQAQNNITASAAILAGLVLNQETILQLLRRDLMRESVIYQWIKTEGREETLQEVAINLLSTGMSLDQIARVTGLSIEQLRLLQQQTQG